MGYRILKVGGEDAGELACADTPKLEVGGKAVDRQLSHRVTRTPRWTESRYTRGDVVGVTKNVGGGEKMEARAT